MKHSINQFVAAIGIAGAGLGAVSQAQAVGIAFAENQVTGVTITPSGGFSVVGAISVDTPTTAQYSGFASSGFQNPQFGGVVSDALQATSGPGPFPGQNNYVPMAGISLGMIGARGDAIASGNPLAGGSMFSNVAGARTVDSSTGGSSGRRTLEAVINLTANETVTFSFTDVYNLFASTTLAGEAANASIANTFDIINSSGVKVFSFAPLEVNGSCGSANGFPMAGCNSSGTTTFTSAAVALAAGTYGISARSTSQVNVIGVAPVPEPETYALMLAGLGALGFVSRRLKKQG